MVSQFHQYAGQEAAGLTFHRAERRFPVLDVWLDSMTGHTVICLIDSVFDQAAPRLV